MLRTKKKLLERFLIHFVTELEDIRPWKTDLECREYLQNNMFVHAMSDTTNIPLVEVAQYMTINRNKIFIDINNSK